MQPVNPPVATTATTAIINGKTVKVGAPQEIRRLTDKNIVKYARVLENLKDR